MRKLWSLVLCIAACGGAQPAAGPAPSTAPNDAEARPTEQTQVPYSVSEPPVPTTGTASQDDAWWANGVCPESSERFGGAPPAAFELGCRTPKGKLEGRFVKFHENGKKAEEGAFQNNLAIGVWTSWAPDGQKLTETSYAGGEKSGVETEWYPGGKIKSQREYKSGKRDGLTTLWDEAGQKRTAMSYKNAQPSGVEVRWDETGKVAKVINHAKN